MKTKIIMAVLLVVIVGVGYWAYDMVRQRNYTGSGIAFDVGGGYVVVTNTGDAPIPIEMRSTERTATFRVESAELDLRESSTRQGTGRDAYHALFFELPPGTAKIDVTRGSGVKFISRSDTTIRAAVTPMESEGVRVTLGFAGAVILIALYYMSNIVKHRWIWALRDRLTGRKLDVEQKTA